MKKLFAGIALLGITAFASAQTISFNETTHDYGTVSPDSDGNCVFIVKNIGDKPLIVSRVQPSCGCTTPQDWTKDPILPGKTGKIYIHFDVKNHPGVFQKMVEVFSNDPQNSRSVINIKGNVDANAPKPTAEDVKKAEAQKVEAQKAAEKDAKKQMKKTKHKKAA